MEIKKLHDWDVSLQAASVLQQHLSTQVCCSTPQHPINFVAGTDISFTKGDSRLFAAVVVLNLNSLEILEVASHVEKSSFPYIPGFLSFREIPPLLKAFGKLNIKPDAVICDGQGIAHPRGIGLASHLGLWLQIPCVGCAKKPLVGDFGSLSIEQGSSVPLVYKEKSVGVVLRSKKSIKPLFISPGHLIDIKGSVSLIKKCLKGYRLPEPTRHAHWIVNRLRKETVS